MSQSDTDIPYSPDRSFDSRFHDEKFCDSNNFHEHCSYRPAKTSQLDDENRMDDSSSLDFSNESVTAEREEVKKFLFELLNVVVLVKKLPELTIRQYERNDGESGDSNNNTDPKQIYCTKDLTVRYCSACNESSENSGYVGMKTIQYCQRCNSRLLLKCIKCEKKYITYEAMRMHLHSHGKLTFNRSVNKRNSYKKKLDQAEARKDGNDCSKKISKNLISVDDKTYNLIGTKALTIKYCLKSKKTVAHDEGLNANTIQMCENCNSSLLLQCRRCGKLKFTYSSATWHLNYDCDKRPVKMIDGRPQQSTIGTKTLMMKYCSTCKKTVTHVENCSVKTNLKCKNCDSRLHWRCKKCAKLCASYNDVHCQLKYQCGKRAEKRKAIGTRNLSKRYCHRCDSSFEPDPNESLKKLRACASCGTALQWKCNKCEAVLEYYVALCRHEIESEIYKCKHCEFKACFRKHMKQHIVSHCAKNEIKKCLELALSSRFLKVTHSTY